MRVASSSGIASKSATRNLFVETLSSTSDSNSAPLIRTRIPRSATTSAVDGRDPSPAPLDRGIAVAEVAPDVCAEKERPGCRQGLTVFHVQAADGDRQVRVTVLGQVGSVAYIDLDEIERARSAAIEVQQ